MLMPFLCTHLDVFVIVSWHEHVMSSFGLQVDTKIVQVVEEERSKEVTDLGEHVEMGDLQIANLGDDRSWRGNAGSQAFEEGVPFRKLRNVHFVFGRVLAKQGKKLSLINI